ncbi:hypothetical protein FB451DRAFT_1261105 [Mycena latifolia]|nr:hypothetical protein FB451DRAFT_1261105 [Mycena latifolia]
MSLTINQIKERCPRFRILVLGRRNAGKTTILKKMCGSDGNDLEIVNVEGEKVDPSILEPNRQRGMSNIENEITFKSNPRFVFHDSRGIEAGAEHEENSPLSTEYLWNFLEKRSETIKIREQVHAIWFCIPMDNPRAPSAEFELAFFNVKRSPVPVIAVFTKFESLLDEAYDTLPEDDDSSDEERDEEAWKAAQSKFKATILKAIQSTKYPPDQFVQLQNLNEVATECAALTEKTYVAIRNKTLADLFALAQRNSMSIGNQKVLEEILRETQGWMQRMGIDNTQIIESVYKYVRDYIPFWRVDDVSAYSVASAVKHAVQDCLPDFVTCLVPNIFSVPWLILITAFSSDNPVALSPIFHVTSLLPLVCLLPIIVFYLLLEPTKPSHLHCICIHRPKITTASHCHRPYYPITQEQAGFCSVHQYGC